MFDSYDQQLICSKLRKACITGNIFPSVSGDVTLCEFLAAGGIGAFHKMVDIIGKKHYVNIQEN